MSQLTYTVVEVTRVGAESNVNLLGVFTTFEAAEKRALYQKKPILTSEYGKSGVFEVTNQNQKSRVLVLRSTLDDETTLSYVAGAAIDTMRGVE